MDWGQWLAGRSLYGTAGFDISNTAATNPADPRLSQYGSLNTQANGSEGGEGVNSFQFNGSGGLSNNGIINRNGQSLVQVGLLVDPANSGMANRIIDPNGVTYDPTYGPVTDPANIRNTDGFLDRYMPVLVGAAFGGAAAFSAMGSGAVSSTSYMSSLDTAGSTGAFDVGGSSGFGGSTALGSGETGTGAFDVGGSHGFGGSEANLGPNPAAPPDPTNPADPGGGGTNPAGGGGNSVWRTIQNVNRVRQGLGLLQALGGGSQHGGKPGMGGSGGGFDVGSLLGLIALGRGVFGQGTGTANGATAAGHEAAAAADPWGAGGNRAAFASGLTPSLFSSMLNPSPESITSQPDYQFRLAQGTNAINTGDAATGTFRSGNRGIELAKFGQGLAATSRQETINNNLAQLGLMGRFAGVESSNPTAAAGSIISGFEGASSLQNNGLNGLLSLLGMGGGGGANGLLSLLGSGGSAITSWLNSAFGSGSPDLSGMTSSPDPTLGAGNPTMGDPSYIDPGNGAGLFGGDPSSGGDIFSGFFGP